MGAKTREAARLWLNKRGVEISPNASVNEIATKMDHLDTSY